MSQLGCGCDDRVPRAVGLTNVEADEARVVRNGRALQERDKDRSSKHHYEFRKSVAVLAA